MDNSLLTELVTIDRERKRLKEELDALNAERAEIEQTILTEWENEQISQMRVDGRTIYVSAQKWARPLNGDRQAVVKVLESLGLDDMVTFNSQTLSSYVREHDKEGEALPEALAAVIEVTEDWKVKTRG